MASRHRRVLIAATAALALAGGGCTAAGENRAAGENSKAGEPATAAPAPASTPTTTTTPKPRVTRSAAVDEARSVVSRNAAAVKSGPGEKYQAVDAVVGADGDRHVRFNRTHRGLPVLGGDFVVHTDANGRFTDATVAQDRLIDVPETAKVSRKQALDVAALTGKVEARKVVDALDGEPALAWEVTGATKVVIVDATTGRIRLSYDTVHTAETGTGHGLHVGDVQLGTTRRDDGTYALIDPDRGGNTVHDGLNGWHDFSIGKFAEFTDADDVWGDGTRADRATVAVDVLYGMAETWDYLKETFGRSGLADDGKGVTAYVHRGVDYGNASWRSACDCMLFGDGEPGEEPFTTIDIVAHELAHGLTDQTADFVYAGEPGGLNESNSDIFGTLVEFYANNPVDAPDYLIGERTLVRDPALRRMDEPSLDGKSASCWTPTVKSLDVHYSSGVGNKFFYNLAVGSGASQWGESTPCGAAGPVTGIGNDKAARIWFHALSVYMVSNTDYAGAREATLRAAADLYGADSTERRTVDAAWLATGVDDSQTPYGAPVLVPFADSTPSPQLGEPVRIQLAARDPQHQPITFSATNLPSGVTISADGLISGTPDTRARFVSSITATDSDGNRSAAAMMLWSIKGPPLVVDVSPKVTEPFGGYSYMNFGATFIEDPDYLPDIYDPLKVTATGLPDGLTLRVTTPSGQSGRFVASVVGKPTGMGSGTVVLTAVDADRNVATATIPWEVYPARLPGYPPNVTVTGGDTGTAKLTWERPAYGPEDAFPNGYVVRVLPGGAETRLDDWQARSLTLTGLDIRRTYTIGVRATSTIGDGLERTVTLAPPALPISATPAAVTYGQTSLVSGRVLRGSSPVAGVTVVVEHRPAGKSTWSRFATVQTDGKGIWRATARSATTSAIRVRHLGSTGLWPATSANTWLSVRYAVTAKASTTKPKADKKIKIFGTAKPARAGVQVTLQYRKGSRWINITSTKTTKTGSYVFNRAFKRGTWNLRVVVAGGGYNATGTSGTVKLTAK
ncbi:M4 family metallopeptidase [Actinoplanes sichuanensis]|nr:M4 family metallopeptidase [Actinoplanes sichuanensis]